MADIKWLGNRPVEVLQKYAGQNQTLVQFVGTTEKRWVLNGELSDKALPLTVPAELSQITAGIKNFLKDIGTDPLTAQHDAEQVFEKFERLILALDDLPGGGGGTGEFEDIAGSPYDNAALAAALNAIASSASAASAWGTIVGTLSNQTDLQNALNAKANIQTATEKLTELKTVDGTGSGLDADLLDGQDGSYYLNRANHTGTQPWSTITNTPTTLAGYGITDAPTGSVTSVGLALAPSVFSITGSPVTTTGTLTGSLLTQTANFIWAGPTSGGAAAPAFRSLVSADIPSTLDSNARLAVSKAGVAVGTRRKLNFIEGANVALTIADDAGNEEIDITITSTAAGGGGGTVTSVGLGLPSSVFSVTNSPVTITGTLTGSFISQTANQVFAAPDGTNGTPTFRTLTATDIPNLSTAKLTSGTLPIARGGTGLTTIASGKILYTSALDTLATADITAFGRSLIDDADAAAARTTLGLGTAATSNTGDFATSGHVHAAFTSTVNGFVPAPTTVSGRFLKDDGTWSLGNTGTVTSVGLSLPGIFTVTNSPVINTGTLTGTLATQTANFVWAGPNTGSAAQPTFRALVADDIPNLNTAKITSGTFAISFLPVATSGVPSSTQVVRADDSRLSDARTPTAHAASHASGGSDPLTGNLDATARVAVSKAGTVIGTRRRINFIEGSNVTLTIADDSANEDVDVTINSTAAGGGGGTVTSVGLALPASVFTVTNSPVTTTGTLTGSLATQTANLVWAGPNTGSAAAPTFRSLVVADIPTLDAATKISGLNNGATISGVVASRMLYTTATDTWAATTVTSAGRNMLAFSPAQGTFPVMGAGSSWGSQAITTTGRALVNTSIAANQILYGNGTDTFTTTALTAGGRSVIGLALGTALQQMRVNSLGTAVEWFTPNPPPPAGVTEVLEARAVATTNITLSGTQTIDGVALIAGDKVLTTAQTTQTDNRLWVVAAGSWTAATELDANAEIFQSLLVTISEGTNNANSIWALTTASPTITPAVALDWKIQSINATKLQGRAISTTSPTINQTLTFDGTKWVPKNLPANYLFAKRTTDLTLTNATNNTISFPTEVVDANNSFDGTTFTVPTGGGNYRAYFYARLSASGTISTGDVQFIFKRGATVIGINRYAFGSAATYYGFGIYDFLDMVAGETIQAVLFINFVGATSVKVDAAIEPAIFSITKF